MSKKELFKLLAGDENLRKAVEYFGAWGPGASQRPGLEKGSTVEGVVTEVQDCSVFLDLGGGARGLVHVSDLSWARFDHPSDIVSPGDKLRVKVLHNPPTSQVIHLGLKQLTPDPWDTAEQDFPAGTRVEALVTHVNKRGAWFEVAPGIESCAGADGLREAAGELDWRELLQVGQRVTITVKSVNEQLRFMVLAWEPQVWEAGQ